MKSTFTEIFNIYTQNKRVLWTSVLYNILAAVVFCGAVYFGATVVSPEISKLFGENQFITSVGASVIVFLFILVAVPFLVMPLKIYSINKIQKKYSIGACIKKATGLSAAYLIFFVPITVLCLSVYLVAIKPGTILKAVTYSAFTGALNQRGYICLLGLIPVILVLYILYCFLSFSAPISVFEGINPINAAIRSVKSSARVFFKIFAVNALWLIVRFAAAVFVAWILSFIIKTPHSDITQSYYNTIYSAIRAVAAFVLTGFLSPITAFLHAVLFSEGQIKNQQKY